MTTPLHRFAPGDRIDARYVVRRMLGEGGFSAVYLAEQEATGQQVAVKVLNLQRSRDAEQLRARFEREMRVVGRLHHPHVVRLIDRGTLQDGGLFTVYAYVRGRTLHDHIQQTGPLPPEQARTLASQMLDALVAAHDAGVVHRDIKPRNLMVTTTGAVHNALLLDFGLAGFQPNHKQADEQTLSRVGLFMGTPPYAAPEQIKGARASPGMDLYAWGLVLAEMLTGARVFSGGVPHVVAAQLSSAPVPIPREVRAGPFGRLLESVLEKDPLRREHDARVVWTELQAVDLEQGRAARAGSSDTPHGTELAMFDEKPALEGVVGRGVELDLLQARWEQVQAGTGQAVYIDGDAGLGKSHLLRGMAQRVGTPATNSLRCACTPENAGRPWGPLLDALATRIRHETARELQSEPVLRWWQDLGVDGEPAEVVASLLCESAELPSRIRQLPPAARHEAIDDALLDAVAAIAEERPLVLVVEDLHWAGASMVGWCAAFAAEVEGLACLFVCTSRTPLPAVASLTDTAMHRMPLSPLDPADARRLIEGIAGPDVPPELVQRVVSLADGVPLFVEELTRALVERDMDPGILDQSGVHADDLPRRVGSVVETRLADAGEALDVLSTASVWGRSCTAEQLGYLWQGSRERLEQGLRVLQQRALIRRTGRRRRPVYTIKHQLIRDAAYASLESENRLALHERAAHWLREHTASRGGSSHQPEVLAHHLARGGQNAEAVCMLAVAASRATERTAMEEALSHVQEGLSLLATEQPSVEITRAELELRVAEAPVWFAKASYGSRPAESTLLRGLELSRTLGGTRHDFLLQWGLWVCTTAQSRHQDGLRLARDLLRIARERGDEGLLLEAHLAMGHTLYYLPRLAEGVEHLEQCQAMYDAVRHREHAQRFGQDPMVMSSVFAAVMTDLLGRPDLAQQHLARGSEAALQRDHAMSRAMMMCIRTVHHQVLQEPEATQRSAEQLVTFSQRARMPYWGSIGRIYAAWARSRMGHTASHDLEAAVEDFLATGSANNSAAYFTMLAEVQIADGHRDAARRSVAEAERRAQRFCEQRMLAETLRLKGRHLVGDRSEAMACLESARQLARDQGARLLEIRALASSLELVADPALELQLSSALARVLDALPSTVDCFDVERARRALGHEGSDATFALSMNESMFA